MLSLVPLSLLISWYFSKKELCVAQLERFSCAFFQSDRPFLFGLKSDFQMYSVSDPLDWHVRTFQVLSSSSLSFFARKTIFQNTVLSCMTHFAGRPSSHRRNPSSSWRDKAYAHASCSNCPSAYSGKGLGAKLSCSPVSLCL